MAPINGKSNPGETQTILPPLSRFTARPPFWVCDRFDDGRVAEIFINASGRAGGEIEVLSKDAAICASKALQVGISLDELRRSLMRSPSGAASGVLGAALDLLAAEDRSS
jgi:ribonucleoside-diphosphate reductase alpha chain